MPDLLLTQAQLGVPIRVLDPTPGCPASPVAAQTEGSFRDPAAIAAFAQQVGHVHVQCGLSLRQLCCTDVHEWPAIGDLQTGISQRFHCSRCNSRRFCPPLLTPLNLNLNLDTARWTC